MLNIPFGYSVSGLPIGLLIAGVILGNSSLSQYISLKISDLILYFSTIWRLVARRGLREI